MEYTTPFYHLQVDDFLSSSDFDLILDFYSSRKFSLKYNDLFKFLQTDELASDKNLDFFKNELNKVFGNIVDLEDTYYSIFASCYRKGDFLSCHDDLVDERLYAFTFYLDDLKSGDLILFNKECDQEVKRISIKKNKLVIFQVSDISFHEVEICKHEFRKAITGWINKKNHKNALPNYTWNYKLPDVEYVPFELENTNEDVLIYEGMEYSFNTISTHLKGSFVMRRINTLTIDPCIVLEIPNYTLYYVESYLVGMESYILVNDFTNQIEGDLLDIFIIESKGEQENNIKFIDEAGDLVHTLEILPKVMYVIKRKKMKYFIERGLRVNYKVIHMIYKLN